MPTPAPAPAPTWPRLGGVWRPPPGTPLPPLPPDDGIEDTSIDGLLRAGVDA